MTGCYKNNEFRCILMTFSYIACGGSILQVSDAARDRERKKVKEKKRKRTKCLTTIHLICIISTVIYAITLPEHGLTEPVSALDHGGVTLWNQNHSHSINHSVCLSSNSHSKGKCAIVCLNKDNIHWTLTAVLLITAVTTIIPAVAAHGWFYTAFIVALEQLRAGWEIQKLNSLSNVHIETTLTKL